MYFEKCQDLCSVPTLTEGLGPRSIFPWAWFCSLLMACMVQSSPELFLRTAGPGPLGRCSQAVYLPESLLPWLPAKPTRRRWKEKALVLTKRKHVLNTSCVEDCFKHYQINSFLFLPKPYEIDCHHCCFPDRKTDLLGEVRSIGSRLPRDITRSWTLAVRDQSPLPKPPHCAVVSILCVLPVFVCVNWFHSNSSVTEPSH